MNITARHRTLVVSSALVLAFAVAIMVATTLTLEFGSIANAPTAAFSFLIIVLLAAFFGDFVVGVLISVIAALCFNYFYLPPVGTFCIDAFSDWISFAAFLLTAVAISGLTASAARNRSRACEMDKAQAQLTEFGSWLLSIPDDKITLTGIAEEATSIFSLEYCSIHVYSEGKWLHYTGTAASELSREIEKKLLLKDHPTDLMEMADENALGVRYVEINQGKAMLALLSVRSTSLPTSAIGTMGYMIGVRLMRIMKDKQVSA